MAEDQYHLTITQLGYDPVSKPPQFHKYNKDFFFRNFTNDGITAEWWEEFKQKNVKIV